jgi:hypothetical protein
MTTDTAKPAAAGTANGLLKIEQVCGQLNRENSNALTPAQGRSTSFQIIWSFWRAAEFIAAVGPR